MPFLPAARSRTLSSSFRMPEKGLSKKRKRGARGKEASACPPPSPDDISFCVSVALFRHRGPSCVPQVCQKMSLVFWLLKQENTHMFTGFIFRSRKSCFYAGVCLSAYSVSPSLCLYIARKIDVNSSPENNQEIAAN